MDLLVLVVDDDPLARKAIERALRGRCATEALDDGARVLERLRAGARYALILCDVMMPRTTGLDVADALRRELPCQLARFVFVTGGARSPEDQVRLEQSGVPILEKPFSRQQLLAVVEPYLDVRRPLTQPSRCHPEDGA